MKRGINKERLFIAAILGGFFLVVPMVNAQTSFPSSPPQFYPPAPSPGPPSYTPVPPQPPPQAPQVPSTGIKEKGVINPRTGEFYPGTNGGVINPRTGVILPKVEGGYLNPETGEVIPKKE